MTEQEYREKYVQRVNNYHLALALAIYEIEEGLVPDNPSNWSPSFVLKMYKDAKEKGNMTLQVQAEKDMLRLTGRAYLANILPVV